MRVTSVASRIVSPSRLMLRQFHVSAGQDHIGSLELTLVAEPLERELVRIGGILALTISLEAHTTRQADR